MPRKLTQDTEEAERQLSRMGRLQLCRITQRAELEGPLQDCFALELESWKGANSSAMASQAATLGFYTDLANAAADAGALTIYTLRLDGRLIAFEYSLTRHGIVYLVKISYDGAFSKYSPGNVLRYLRLRDEIERHATIRYDFGIVSAWKSQWTPNVSRLALFRIYFPHPRALAAFYLGPALRQTLKSFPTVARAVDSLRAIRVARKQARHAKLRRQVAQQLSTKDTMAQDRE